MNDKTLEQKLDEAIAQSQRTIEAGCALLAELQVLHGTLDELQTGTRERLVVLAADELEAIENENVGESFCTRPWQW